MGNTVKISSSKLNELSNGLSSSANFNKVPLDSTLVSMASHLPRFIAAQQRHARIAFLLSRYAEMVQTDAKEIKDGAVEFDTIDLNSANVWKTNGDLDAHMKNQNKLPTTGLDDYMKRNSPPF
jgi:uncharacterized protein YcbX